MIEKTVSVKISLSAEELAREWCSMDGEEQAEFFHWIGEIAEMDWQKALCFQLQFIEDAIVTANDKTAMSVMRQIGEYSGDRL